MTDIKNIHQRLASVMEEVTYIQKERKQGMQYTIVNHDKVTAKVRPALLKAGIVYYPVRCDHSHNGNRAECSMTVRFVNVDEPSDFFDVPTFGYGIDSQDKGPGKAMSYAVKYALLKALGLETGDDADHDSIEHDDTDPAVPQKSEDEKRRDWLLETMRKANTRQKLDDWWNGEKITAAVEALPEPMKLQVTSAKTDLWPKLQDDPARQAA